jgi:hypothetical protein
LVGCFNHRDSNNESTPELAHHPLALRAFFMHETHYVLRIGPFALKCGEANPAKPAQAIDSTARSRGLQSVSAAYGGVRQHKYLRASLQPWRLGNPSFASTTSQTNNNTNTHRFSLTLPPTKPFKDVRKRLLLRCFLLLRGLPRPQVKKTWSLPRGQSREVSSTPRHDMLLVGFY